MIPRFGPVPRRDIAYSHRMGAYAILPRRGELLLTLQHEPELELQLPGGGIDPGESPLRALHREVYEETGWIIAQPRKLGAFRRFVYMPEYDKWAEKLCLIYKAFPVRPHGAPTEVGHTALWTSPDFAAEALGNSGDRYFVSRYLANP